MVNDSRMAATFNVQVGYGWGSVVFQRFRPSGAKAAARTFDDTPLMQKVLRRGTLETPTTPSPATPVKNLDLSASFEGPDSKENLPAYQEGKAAPDNSRMALTPKNKWP